LSSTPLLILTSLLRLGISWLRDWLARFADVVVVVGTRVANIDAYGGRWCWRMSWKQTKHVRSVIIVTIVLRVAAYMGRGGHFAVLGL
jgi:hypothetical protein